MHSKTKEKIKDLIAISVMTLIASAIVGFIIYEELFWPTIIAGIVVFIIVWSAFRMGKISAR